MKLSKFIKFNTKEMNKESRALLYSIVKDGLGDKVSVVKSTDKDGQPTSTRIFHKIDDGKHWYIIPLSKNPTEDEINSIADKMIKNLNMGDLEIESSLVESNDIFDKSLSEGDYQTIAEKFAQKLHEDWMEDRNTSGWRYGEQRNDEHKTHPLMKAWHQLSEEEKTIKPHMVKDLVNILKDNGYKVTKK